jgi:hypothetical protein
VLKVGGSKIQEYEVLCALCECFVSSEDEVYIVGNQVFHEMCLVELLSKPEQEFEDILRVVEERSWYTSLPEEVLKELVGDGELQVNTIEELRKLYIEKGLSASTEVKLEDVVEEGFEVPEDVVVRLLNKLEEGALDCRARSVVERALKDVGLIEEFRVKEPTPEQYCNFVLKIKEEVSKMLKNSKQLEFKMRVGSEGSKDIDIYVNGRYIGTWKIIKSHVRTLWDWIYRWIERVGNLLTLLAMMGLIREELLEWRSIVVPERFEAMH